MSRGPCRRSFSLALVMPLVRQDLLHTALTAKFRSESPSQDKETFHHEFAHALDPAVTPESGRSLFGGQLIRRWAAGALLTLCVGAPAAAHADPTASAWRGLDDAERMAYVFGVIDGLSSTQAIFKSVRAIRAQTGATEPVVITEALLNDALTCWIQRKATSMQMFTVVERYITAHPAEWGHQMGPLVMKALTDGCAR